MTGDIPTISPGAVRGFHSPVINACFPINRKCEKKQRAMKIIKPVFVHNEGQALHDVFSEGGAGWGQFELEWGLRRRMGIHM